MIEVLAEELALFRFQIFYEDTIRPLVERNPTDVRKSPGVAVGGPLGLFEVGELHEATAVAALAVACGVLPRQPFRAMLESRNVQRVLSGDVRLELTTADFRALIGETVEIGPPITELPDNNDILKWSEIEMVPESRSLMSALTDEYASLIRQVRRNAFQRKFNATLLFAAEDRWQEELSAFASVRNSWFPRSGSEDSLWLAEGLDSYLDFAEDVGAATRTDTFGLVSHFSLGDVGNITANDVRKMIAARSLLPLMAWRFGGSEIALTVNRRVQSLEELIVRLVTETDLEEAGTQRLRATHHEFRQQ